MPNRLTLSVIIPKDRIKKSLALSLIDIDSHFNSLRYSSLEFVILNDNPEEDTESISDNFSSMVPSIISASSDNVKNLISGDNVIVINEENIDRDILDKATDFVKEDVSVAVISSQTDLSFLDKITNFLIKILKFKKTLRSTAFPHVIYMKRETFNDFHHLKHHELVTFFDFNNHDIEVLEKDHFKRPGFIHYLKVWFHLIFLKLKIIFNSAKSKIFSK